ncbi:MAG: hypothetical protein JJ866_18665 [Roseibium sp.]|uniref:hypothetical protein n=1 Tax=Roseibium sp. TaxID=1936156 RepID=UPI001B20E4F0|nr:hypothetical protein [Roseibium sp.]MBO6893970.1 hypothetical protein [Roseibium sp.]MBO6932263.1 hypothetical protein [Roseibium sp.]
MAQLTAPELEDIAALHDLSLRDSVNSFVFGHQDTQDVLAFARLEFSTFPNNLDSWARYLNDICTGFDADTASASFAKKFLDPDPHGIGKLGHVLNGGPQPPPRPPAPQAIKDAFKTVMARYSSLLIALRQGKLLAFGRTEPGKDPVPIDRMYWGATDLRVDVRASKLVKNYRATGDSVRRWHSEFETIRLRIPDFDPDKNTELNLEHPTRKSKFEQPFVQLIASFGYRGIPENKQELYDGLIEEARSLGIDIPEGIGPSRHVARTWLTRNHRWLIDAVDANWPQTDGGNHSRWKKLGWTRGS